MNEPVTLTVNGEKYAVMAEPRTQLAEILRDHLDYTGTHLGCEQGVCGACTVMVDGIPVRSCIIYARACEGASVDTVEGFQDDIWMMRLRDAFSRHHALQCGFCTPGMLVTARDIVRRFKDPDERTIRHELSGNLCRCTGYMGIVAAILDVAQQRKVEQGGMTTKPHPRPEPPAPLRPFEPAMNNFGLTDLSISSVRTDGAWTIVERELTLQYSNDRVWALFSDLRKVALCVPGASITDISRDEFTGAIEIRFGPIKANVGGNGRYVIDTQSRTGNIEGKGDDRNGNSTVRGKLDYHMINEAGSDHARVQLMLSYQIEGMLAQFNRKELVTGFVDYIIGQFSQNCDDMLAGRALTRARQLNIFAIGLAVVKSWLAGLFRKV